MNDIDLGDLPEEMAEAILHGDAVGVIATEIPNLRPPSSEWVLDTLRTMINDDGHCVGMVMAATATMGLMIPVMAGLVDPLLMLVAMRKQGMIDPVCWVTIGADTYVRLPEEGWVDDGLTPTEAFEQGLPDAREAVLAWCLAPDGPGYDVEQVYRRTSDGVEWDEPTRFKERSEGRLMDLMEMVVTA